MKGDRGESNPTFLSPHPFSFAFCLIFPFSFSKVIVAGEFF